MKPSYVLLNVVLVAAGLFLYHTLVGAPAPAPTGGDYSHLEPDDLGEIPPGDDTPILLDSGADQALSRRNAENIADLKRELALYLAKRRSAGTASDDPLASAGGTMPALSDLDQVDEDNPQFDERSLRSLETMLDEINRRKAEARNRTRLEGELTRLGVDLTDEQRGAVVEATVAYQGKARALLQQGWPRDEAGRASRKEAFGKLRDEYTATLGTLVPAAEAEKISSSRISRSYGSFFGNQRRGGRNANREKRNADR
ncbi:MAG: hypothetical protein P1V36_13895 [Planctomycetota bacterium]|nr:hypothetical protein [Planctomycetota bacterium]